MTGLRHVDDYPEIPISLDTTRSTLKTGAWRSVRPVLVERRAPCSAGCPAGVGIPAYAADVAAGRLAEAFAKFTARNPFPRITGRVCPHTCEAECNLDAASGPVSIRAVERWFGDATAHLPHPVGESTGKKIAVVGAGPAGLAAAYYLRRTGHDVVVFDRRERPGGLLRYGIPDYRLPSAIVDDETARLTAMGIDFRPGVALGTDVGLDDLEATYAAVFVATGAWQAREVGIPGASLLEPGLAFLEAAKRGKAELPGERCAVIGGGNTALDVARLLRRMRARVTVLYRRTAAEMPAIAEEYERAVADGIEFEWLVAPRSVVKAGGRLEVTVADMRLGRPDASGRPASEPIGRTRQLAFDAVFAAIGETADVAPFPVRLLDGDGWVASGAEGATGDANLFVGGDLATGPATVVEAIVAGRRAARAIDHQLGFGHLWPEEELRPVVPASETNPTYVPGHSRLGPLRVPTFDPVAEETLTASPVAVLAEIERCLSCGTCNDCGTCFVFCPDGAIAWLDGPAIDYEFCKGCGICVTECPGHALVLVNERELAHA